MSLVETPLFHLGPVLVQQYIGEKEFCFMKKQPKRRITKKLKTELPERPLNDALTALCAISYWVLCQDALDSPEGREDLRQMFRDSLAAVPGVQLTPEWRLAMEHVARINSELQEQR